MSCLVRFPFHGSERKFSPSEANINCFKGSKKVKGKGKVHPRTGHEIPEGERWYNSTLPSTLALDGVGGQPYAVTALPKERPGTHCIGGRVGPRAGLDGCGKSRLPTGIRSPGPPAHSESLYRLSYRGP